MYKNFLVTAFRNLLKHKMFSFINLTGLAVGIAASYMLLGYVNSELSYDRFHKNGENIYRIRLDSYRNGVFDGSSAIGYYGAAPAIKEEFPKVVNYTRLHRADGMLNYYDDRGNVISHYEPKGLYADSSFFSVFSFPLIKGNPKTILRSANSMVISESAASKYFGKEDPIGKAMKLNTEWKGGEFIVEGVFKDIPENSHVQFDFLFAIHDLLRNQQFLYGAWYWTNFYTYLLVEPNTNIQELENSLALIIDKNLGKDLRRENSAQVMILQPLKDIHLKSNAFYELEVNSDYQLVYFMSIVAALIIGIAWLNYLNLSTAKAIERAKEVGVRKVLGSAKRQIIVQFLLESFMLSGVSLALGALIVLVCRSYFYEILGRTHSQVLTNQHVFWLSTGGVLVVGTFLSCLYPAAVLSSFQPILALKGKFVKRSKGAVFQKGIVVLQFSASIVLIIATLVIGRQIKFMRDQEMGMTIDNKMIIRTPKIAKGESYSNEIEKFKNQLLQNSAIKKVTTSSEVPGKEIFWTKEYSTTTDFEATKKVFSILSIDDDFLETYNIQLLAGRNFSKQNQADFGAVLINESGMKLLGILNPETAIKQPIYEVSTAPKSIIGVIKDFHQQSIKKQNVPLLLTYGSWMNDFFTVSFNGSKGAASNVELVVESYKRTFPENAIEYFFLDEFYDRQFRAEERFSKIFTIFSGLAIFIACIGLFALSSLLISQRTKEVGIRKIMGGSVANILMLLITDFLKLIVIAIIVAIPAGYFLMSEWLQRFATRIDIPVSVFIAAGIAGLLTAAITVFFQAFKASVSNPVETIRIE